MPRLPNIKLPHINLPKDQDKRKGPLWKGPVEDGVSVSLLNKYLSCKERFRLLAIDGLKEADRFKAPLEYGNMWHACEQAHASNPMTREPQWEHTLADYARKLGNKYPMQRQEIEHWFNICLTAFPLYLKWWEKHPDQVDCKVLEAEKVFEVPYKLPSGRLVKMRGKRDAVNLLGKTNDRDYGVYLFETKTKGEIIPQLLKRQLTFDLQAMFYLVALQAEDDQNIHDGVWIGEAMGKGFEVGNGASIKGFRYNVVRRPCSGGKGSITRHKPSKKNRYGETADEFYTRLGEVIGGATGSEWKCTDGEHFFFQRWKVGVTQEDIERYKKEFLHPVLENLLDDYEWWNACYKTHGSVWQQQAREKLFPDHKLRHFRLPYGIYNPVAEGVPTEMDEYLATGSMAGLVRAKTLFPELEEAT